MSKKEKRQNLKVIQHDLVKKVFVRYPGLSLADLISNPNDACIKGYYQSQKSKQNKVLNALHHLVVNSSIKLKDFFFMYNHI